MMIFLSIFSVITFSIIYIAGLFTNEASNNSIFYGVRIPLGYDKHDNLKQIKKEFKKEFNLSFLIFILVYFGLILLFKKQAMSIFVIFSFISIILIYVNYYRTYKKVIKIKKEEQWQFESGKIVVVDLKRRNTGEAKKKLNKGLYLIPFMIILISFIIAVKADIIIVAIMQLFTTAIILSTTYIINNSKQQLNGGEVNELREKNERFKYYFALLNLITAVAINLSLFIQILSYANYISSPVFWFGSIAIIFIPCIIMIIGAILIGQSGKNLSVNNVSNENKLIINRDDDENYIFGCFYYNKDDPAVFVPKRLGIGSDFNYARKSAKVFIAFILVVIVATVALTFAIPSFTKEKKITLETNQMVIEGMYGIKLSYENMEEVKIMDDFPKDMFKKNGTAIDNVLIGKFRNKTYGDCTLYIMDDTKPFIFIKVKDSKPIFINYEDSTRTTNLYNEIIEKTKK